MAKMTQVAQEFSVEIDSAKQAEWSTILSGFADANIFQTWAYEVVRSGPDKVSNIALKEGGRIVAAAQARLIRIPLFKGGMAYVRWAPLCKVRGEESRWEVFRQIVRALRNEYVLRRCWGIRLVPQIFEGNQDRVRRILEEEGYAGGAKRHQTILMDIKPSLEDLNRGFHQKWRNCLNSARKKGLEIIEGENDDLFQAFETIYDQMHQRKQFSAAVEPAHFRKVQKELPPQERMRVVLCKAKGEICAGAICSALGETGVYLFGATSNEGMKTNGSYLVQWKILEWLKHRGCSSYDLNGINRATNEGTYRFKTRLAGAHGREVNLLGAFDATPNLLFRWLVSFAGALRVKLRMSTGLFK
jgi:hypothetical protein